jgi:hypothetical protein
MTKLLGRLCNVSAPMLEYLTIAPGCRRIMDFEGNVDVVTNMDLHIFKGGVPKLTYLMLDAHMSRVALPPLSNITILRIEQRYYGEPPVFGCTIFLELLSLPSLNQLSLCGNLVEYFDISQRIHMPNLERFRVIHVDFIWDFLPGIHAPQLDTLIIRRCWLRSARASPLLPDRDYAFPALRKLYVIDSDVKPSTAAAFIHLTSQATDVSMSGRKHARESLLQSIVNGYYAYVVWPRLQILSCNMTADPTDLDTLFARSRPKVTFRLHPNSVYEFEWNGGLRSLKKVSSVVLDEGGWEPDEQFWPQDLVILEN